MSDPYDERTYGAVPVGFGEKPGVIVVDYQIGITDPKYLGGAPLMERGIANTSRLLEVARRCNVPIATCFTAYHSKRDMPYWKVGKMYETAIMGHPAAELDPRIYDPAYDVVVRKTGASIFYQTPVVSYFIKERVDTVIVTGCVTSGCIRASVIDSFEFGFRTILPEDCSGDHGEGPHRDNIRDMNGRYCDISSADEVILYFEKWRQKNQ